MFCICILYREKTANEEARCYCREEGYIKRSSGCLDMLHLSTAKFYSRLKLLKLSALWTFFGGALDVFGHTVFFLK